MRIALLMFFAVSMVYFVDEVFSDEEWLVPGDTEDPEDYQANWCSRTQVRKKNCLNGGRCQKRIYADGRIRLVCLCRVSGSSSHIGDRSDYYTVALKEVDHIAKLKVRLKKNPFGSWYDGLTMDTEYMEWAKVLAQLVGRCAVEFLLEYR